MSDTRAPSVFVSPCEDLAWSFTLLTITLSLERLNKLLQSDSKLAEPEMKAQLLLAYA